MPTVTLKVLTSVLHMHSPDGVIGSDNQGLNALLADVDRQRADGKARIMEAATKGGVGAYKRVYFPRIQYPRTQQPIRGR
jgi:hypothetical protein